MFPSLIYDYYGFAKEAYEIKYPVSGAPELANKIFNLLGNAGIGAQLDDQRGFDHGLFMPLKLMYPKATNLSRDKNLHSYPSSRFTAHS